MKTICIVTGSRAEFGLLFPLIQQLNNSVVLECKLVVTGSHLDGRYGSTESEIKEKGIKIDKRIKLPLNFKYNDGMAKCTGMSVTKFAQYFNDCKPDMVVVLGDRYEIFGACIAAAMENIPIAHIAGGETSQGAVDEFIRHSITKMSWLHFTSCEEYRKRVIQLGEDPKRVFNVGSLSADNIKNIKRVQIKEIERELEIDLTNQKYALVTYHPTTIEGNNTNETQELIGAISKYKDINFVITKANADAGGSVINSIWNKEVKKHNNWRLVDSLGVSKYITLMEKASAVIGNSSSGIIEAPILNVPTVNIGNRQNGRLKGPSIIDCKANKKFITKAIDKALSQDFNDYIAKSNQNIYGKGNTAHKIGKIIERVINKKIDLKKEFYDIEW